MQYINKKVQPTTADERILGNISHSLELTKRGLYEVQYDWVIDTWYWDLNGTITKDEDLGMVKLRHLDEGVYEHAKEILKMNLPYKKMVGSIAALIKGYSVAEYKAASLNAAEEVEVRDGVKGDLTSVTSPSRLVIFTGAPQEPADMFTQMKVYPLFSKFPSYIEVLGTLLEQRAGRLTGRTLRVMDERERNLHMYLTRQFLTERVLKQKFGKTSK